ncbi:MAG: ABC transporter ATP-binding protein [Gemmatimonas sp.]|uniref:ABC transporter ATP-binding protein n=2 Tax=Gemmatimonas sp. TaxID=1962908 RepID=UPI00391F90E4|nr:ABC transporter ATP-binding protein [Gemmatimonadota bacterium]
MSPATPQHPLLDVQSLQIAFPATDGGGGGDVRAVDGVSFTVACGETVCLVGESGCGKSLTALSLLRLVPPPGRIAHGSHILFDGRDLLTLDEPALRDIRGRQMAMIFQEPTTALNPVLTVGEQIAEVVRVHTRANRREAWAQAVAMLTQVGIADASARAKQYPHELSGGMRQRVMIAMALVLAPKLVIADEPTTALDVTIQAQILELLRDLRARTGMALLLITHDLGVVAEMAARVIVMYAGRVVEEAPVEALFARPAHPYTEGLLAAMPRLGDEQARLTTISGTVPAPSALPSGCAFRDRCPRAFERCAREAPVLYQVGVAHRARCHLVQEREHQP